MNEGASGARSQLIASAVEAELEVCLKGFATAHTSAGHAAVNISA